MKNNTCLVLDVWEGQLEIDETVLRAAGVAGISIRLNNMSGGHHMDTGFLKQWEEAKSFVRFPYFVYNPWVDGAANFAWLKAHMPADARSVAIDVEVRYNGYPANKYAGELVKFLDLCRPLWKTIIYTAEWFLPYLLSWPKVDYWWAQYPDAVYYFGQVKTWDDLKKALDKLDKPFNVSKVPGLLKMWQFTGDYLTLPGTVRKIDVNIFYGNETDLAEYFGDITPEPIPVPIPEPVITPRLYIVKDDIWAGTTIRKGYPATKRYQGGRGSVKLSEAWLEYVWEINQPKWAYQFERRGLLKKYVGWCNQGNNVVEELTFAGNIVRGVSDGERVYIETYSSDAPPPPVKMPDENNLDTRIQMFSTQYPTYTDMTTNGRNPRTVLLSNPGERVYFSIDALAEISLVKRTVKITAAPWLRVRAWPSTKAQIMRNLFWASSVYVQFVTQIGADYWGRVAGGWIGLKVGGYYYSSWREVM